MTSISILQEPISSTSVANGPSLREAFKLVEQKTETPTDGQSPLLLDGWLEFNRIVHGLEPRRFSSGFDTQGATLDAVLYLDDRGRVRHPWRNPYLPVDFRPTPTGYAHRIERQWHDAVAPLVSEMRQRGVVNTLNLPPSVQDVRPWLWAGYRVGLRYSYLVDFPFDRALTSKAIRSRIRSAERKGYRVERTTDFDQVYECLRSTEVRQGYRLGVNRADIELAHRLLGDKHLLAFAAFAPNGEMASVTINIHVRGSHSIGWVGGSRAEYMKDGAADLLELDSWDQMERLGATGIDLCGANLPTIAAYKASLGARLVPYYTIEPYSSRRFLAWARKWWHFHRRRGEVIKHAAH